MRARGSYLIMPPVTVPLVGSCQVLNKSWMSSCRWAWALTKPAYLVTSGQSWDATTYIWLEISDKINTQLSLLWGAGEKGKEERGRGERFCVWQISWSAFREISYSGNRWAWILPRVGMRNISAKYYSWPVTNKRYTPRQSINKYSVPSTNFHVDLQRNVGKILLAHLKHMLCQTALRNNSKISLTNPFQIACLKTIITNETNLASHQVQTIGSQPEIHRKGSHCCLVRWQSAGQVPFSEVATESWHHEIWLSMLFQLDQDEQILGIEQDVGGSSIPNRQKLVKATNSKCRPR